jgi:hypothetical protein
MDTQTLLTVVAVVGPLVGVALGAFLAGRFEERHWFRDRRLDAFADAQTAIYNIFASAPHAAQADAGQQLAPYTRLDEAVVKWQETRGRLGILAGHGVVDAADKLHEVVKEIGFAATRREAIDWDQKIEAAKLHRARLTDEMRKELKTR